VVDPGYCVGCGICAGACPTSTPFRRMSDLVPGVDLPDRAVAAIRDDTHRIAAKLKGATRVLVYGCVNAEIAADPGSQSVGVVPVMCSGQVPPSFVDYVVSRGLAEGVMIAGCADNACYNRRGATWMRARIERSRDPQLRARVPDERVRLAWVGRSGAARLRAELEDFLAELERLGPYRPWRVRHTAHDEPGRADA